MPPTSGRKTKKLKRLAKAEVAIIGGTGLDATLNDAEQVRVGTPYGLPPPITIGHIDGSPTAFLPRHGINHMLPPHRVNYRANIFALNQIGVKRIVATNAVGSMRPHLKPGDLVVPHDLVDFTKLRHLTFYDDAPVTHVDVSHLYCPTIRALLIGQAKAQGVEITDQAVLACTEGPRYETPAEIEMLRRLGCDIVGMTGIPEAVLARELEICYATICFVSNMATGMQKRLTTKEVSKVAKVKLPVIQHLLKETIRHLPNRRRCYCASALEGAKFEAR
ncbi:MAG: S-methyl-5'-thioadenosine phosphorylase [Candidatus Bathyarchaeota archaeon]|nr:MAG: S-methyl-5'-thioadenosine phosphorylase [Candidatus Bathyarchaeota archaeon]